MKIINSKSIIKASIAVISLLLATGVCQAQLGGVAPLPQIKKTEGPTLEETENWITQKLDSLSFDFSYDSDGTTFKQSEEWHPVFNGCKLNAMTLNWGGKREKYGTFQFTYVELSEIDPSTIASIVDRSIKMQMLTMGGRKTINERWYVVNDNEPPLNPEQIQTQATLNENWKSTNPVERRPPNLWAFSQGNTDKITFRIDDIALAERIGSAFKHAILLCQKIEVEKKHNQPPPPKEIF